MIIRKKGRKPLGLNEPLRHPDHRRPMSRRDFLAQGFISGAATIVVPSLFGSLVAARKAGADVLSELDPTNLCKISVGAGKIPFICFDLAGGANIAGSNVLVGQRNGQLDLLSTAGYSKLGLPGNMTPGSSMTTSFVNTEFGLAFHSDSAFLRGMQTTTTPATRALVHGAVIPARSENDTGNNPHNPMYGIAMAGADGQLLTLIGSQNSDSGGNSMSPAMYMNPAIRPTKIDRPSDSTGLVGASSGPSVLNQTDTVSVLKAVDRVSRLQLNGPTNTLSPDDANIKQMVDCAYVKSAYMTENFGPTALDPVADANITAIFSSLGGISADSEYAKTAAVMKLVIDGRAGAGTIEMGGFDYHSGDRSTGEGRDFRAGQCMGACLEYAARTGKPLMLYVFSDGSLNSNGMIDNTVGGRGKGQWTGDNQSTACSFFLVLNPTGRAAVHSPASVTLGGGPQIGYFQASGDVNTSSSPAANAVNLLVDTVLLNYMALHGEQGNFASRFPNSGLNAAGSIDALIAFNQIVSGHI